MWRLFCQICVQPISIQQRRKSREESSATVVSKTGLHTYVSSCSKGQSMAKIKSNFRPSKITSFDSFY